MNWRQNVPGWLTLGVLGAIVVGVLALVGWIKPYLAGPDLALTTVYRPKPVPVEVETVKWLTKVETKIVRERVEVPIEVIREIPAKVERRLESDFGIKLPELERENKALVDILAVPKAPHGGEMALTVNTESGKIDGVFRAKPAPIIEFGGIREAGLDIDVVGKAAVGYYRQDLVRVGPAIVNGKVFASMPVAAGGRANYGASVGVAVRF